MRRLIALLALLPTVASSQAVCSAAAQPETTCSAVEQSITITSACECVASVAAPAGPFGGHATLADGLVSYWPLDEESGVRADLVGSNDLTDNNTVGFASVTGPPNFPAGKAASFVAANSEYLSTANNSSFNVASTGFTMNFWYKSSTGDPQISKDDGGSERSWTLASGTFYVFQTDGIFSSVVKSVVDTNWHMVTIWYDPTELKASACLDAGAVSQGSAIASMQDQTSPFWLGRFSTSYSNGLTGHVGFWSRVLTAQERTDLYAAGAGLFYED